jgi:hypothetical protein
LTIDPRSEADLIFDRTGIFFADAGFNAIFWDELMIGDAASVGTLVVLGGRAGDLSWPERANCHGVSMVAEFERAWCRRVSSARPDLGR